MIHPVILSGGSGTRLWPRSRSNTPKQFLPLVGDETLFQATALRVKAMRDVAPVITVCAEDHRFMVGEQLQAIDMPSGGILLEPVARNTAPASSCRAKARPAAPRRLPASSCCSAGRSRRKSLWSACRR